MTILNNRLEYLRAIQAILPPSPMCMEIGVHVGDFSRGIINELKPKELHLIDPFENGIDPISKQEFYESLKIKTVYSDETCLNRLKQSLHNEIEQKVVVINQKLSVDALADYEDNSFDFIYIDACHLYESVLWDLENYIHKIKKGGYIGGHDYFNHPDFGVIQAVNEFCEKHGYKIILLVNENQYGDWLLSAKK